MSAESYLERIRALPCLICLLMGMLQQGKTFAHHIESVRDEFSDFAAVPLCFQHHQGATGVHGLSRREFERRYQLSDVDMLARTNKLLDRKVA